MELGYQVLKRDLFQEVLLLKINDYTKSMHCTLCFFVQFLFQMSFSGKVLNEAVYKAYYREKLLVVIGSLVFEFSYFPFEHWGVKDAPTGVGRD